MTSNIAISVQNLSKCYQIYDKPGDRLKQFIAPRLKSLLGKDSIPYYREFWALKDISFEVKRGETVGIIGRNGSGKSTLLQLICGTLTPTGGAVQTNGRIAALLELGSGFNPEFTGRENVYLNASVLGLKKEEVDERFDRIAAFADIGEFIDQPVKIYSSGMYVKLAFAVIAHVDADILVVDEALAVGDAVFIQKCMRFIRAFQERGTLLFVSHDAASVQNLCKSAIWLGNGQMKLVGTSKKVSEAYLQYTLQEVYGQEVKLKSMEDSSKDLLANSNDDKLNLEQDISSNKYSEKLTVVDNLSAATGWKTGMAEVTSVVLEKLNDNTDIIFEGGENVRLTILAKAHSNLESPILGFTFKDRLGQELFGENTLPFTATHDRAVIEGQTFTAVFEFKLPMLPNGQYVVMASVANGNLLNHVQHHYMHDALIVHVSNSTIRWGLVGIPFSNVSLEINND